MGLEVESLAMLLTSCVTLNKLLSLSVHFLTWRKTSGDTNLMVHPECPGKCLTQGGMGKESFDILTQCYYTALMARNSFILL